MPRPYGDTNERNWTFALYMYVCNVSYDGSVRYSGPLEWTGQTQVENPHESIGSLKIADAHQHTVIKEFVLIICVNMTVSQTNNQTFEGKYTKGRDCGDIEEGDKQRTWPALKIVSVRFHRI